VVGGEIGQAVGTAIYDAAEAAKRRVLEDLALLRAEVRWMKQGLIEFFMPI